jgi:hypothetical protein
VKKKKKKRGKEQLFHHTIAHLCCRMRPSFAQVHCACGIISKSFFFEEDGISQRGE